MVLYSWLMIEQEINGPIDIPGSGNWPGTIESYKHVRPYVKPQLWNFVSIIGLSIGVALVVQIILLAIFGRGVADNILDEAIGIFSGALFLASGIHIFLKAFNNEELSLNDALVYGYHRMLKMVGLLIVMYVLLLVSFLLLVVPFLIVLPRLYLAPYFLIYNDSTVGEALAASWHLTRGHSYEIYGIILLEAVIALLAITIVGIPFAVYFGIINAGSFALMTIYLSQPKTGKKKVNKPLSAEVRPA